MSSSEFARSGRCERERDRECRVALGVVSVSMAVWSYGPVGAGCHQEAPLCL